jgi:hypothetical protein
MKIIASALKLLAVVIGMASAALFMPSPEARPPEARPAKISGVLHPAGVGETGRSPVPSMRLLRTPSPEITSLAEPPPVREQPVAARRVTESSARAAVERDGYRGVHGLTCNESRCTGQALRGQTEINVTVESDGSVRSN